jgi:hypothetical protein
MQSIVAIQLVFPGFPGTLRERAPGNIVPGLLPTTYCLLHLPCFSIAKERNQLSQLVL